MCLTSSIFYPSIIIQREFINYQPCKNVNKFDIDVVYQEVKFITGGKQVGVISK